MKRKHMKLLRFFTSRVVLTSIIILLQIAWLVLLLSQLASHFFGINIAFTVLSVAMVLYVIRKDDNPAYKIGWILIMLLLPLFGGAMYLLVGNKRPSRRMRAQLERVYSRSKPVLVQDGDAARDLEARSPRMYGLSRYISGNARFPVWEHTTSRYFPSGEEMYAAMLPELEAAKHFIFLEYFIISRGEMWDSVLEILTRKAAAGVDVRLIYDDMGSYGINRRKFIPEMERRGIKAMAFNPFVPLPYLAMNNRDHRKILVVDGHTAFTGGINLADEYINRLERFGHWKDTGVLLRGEAVWNFTVMFLEMWNAFRRQDEDYLPYSPYAHHPEDFPGNGFVQPFCDSPLDSETVSENVYLDILSQARRYVYIFTPYLVIDSTLQSALCLAAKRGVDVRLVTPAIPDKKIVFRLTRSYYGPLLREGVRIYEYTPGFIHAKCLVSDDDKGVVGSINLDFRSLYLHFECGALLYGADSVPQVKQDMCDTFAVSREIHLQDTRQSFLGTLFDAILRVFSPLL